MTFTKAIDFVVAKVIINTELQSHIKIASLFLQLNNIERCLYRSRMEAQPSSVIFITKTKTKMIPFHKRKQK